MNKETIEILSETITIGKLIEDYDDCLHEKTIYRIGESWRLFYDFDQFKKTIDPSLTDNQFIDYIFKNFDYDENLFVKILNKPTREEIAIYDENILYADGFDNALVGVRFGFNDNKNIAVYDYDLCVQALMDNDDMDETDAIEFLEFNTLGSYIGEYTPCFLMTMYGE